MCHSAHTTIWPRECPARTCVRRQPWTAEDLQTVIDNANEFLDRHRAAMGPVADGGGAADQVSAADAGAVADAQTQ